MHDLQQLADKLNSQLKEKGLDKSDDFVFVVHDRDGKILPHIGLRGSVGRVYEIIEKFLGDDAFHTEYGFSPRGVYLSDKKSEELLQSQELCSSLIDEIYTNLQTNRTTRPTT